MFFNNMDVGKAEHQWRADRASRRRISPTKRRRNRRVRSSHPTDQVLGLTSEQVVADLGRPAINWL